MSETNIPCEHRTSLHPMSTATVFGLFILTAGECVFQRQDNNVTMKTYYATYRTSISYVNDIQGIDAELCVYTPPSAVPIEQFTIVCMQARIYAPADDLMLLEGIQMVPFPGDPSSDVYETAFLDNDVTDVILHGVVASATAEQSDAGKTFLLMVSDYVRDNIRTSTISYATPTRYRIPLLMTTTVTIFPYPTYHHPPPHLFPLSILTNTHTRSQDISHSHTCHITHHTCSHHGLHHHDIIHDSHSLSMTSSKIQT
jgi:hypothetical protein